ncbi:30S ribosomal protein S5 [Candidatus Pacearchaeota archaeon]|nr:30S ribosomal protein S5 [Candidatus Pacearchaeota archaeon]HIH51983.1 30S ribosomal protein S5 [Nanoarchaeota archaeon]
MESLKKTAKAYGTVSEEEVKTKFEDDKEVLKDILEEEDLVEIEKEVVEEKKEIKPYQRKDRKVEERIAHLAGWVPKTKLGKDVRNGKIKKIDEILDSNQKIIEDEIVDLLLPIKTDLIAIGHAKGKFGGGKRRAWRQTQRITQEGGVMTFSAMAIVGDENGHIGIGVGKAAETLPARDKATRKAKLNLMKIKRACSAFDCSCDDPHSIPFKVEGKAGSVRVIFTPAPQGTGLVVASELKKLLKMAGIKDIYSKTFGKKRTTFNLIKAAIDALEKTNKK